WPHRVCGRHSPDRGARRDDHGPPAVRPSARGRVRDRRARPALRGARGRPPRRRIARPPRRLRGRRLRRRAPGRLEGRLPVRQGAPQEGRLVLRPLQPPPRRAGAGADRPGRRHRGQRLRPLAHPGRVRRPRGRPHRGRPRPRGPPRARLACRPRPPALLRRPRAAAARARTTVLRALRGRACHTSAAMTTWRLALTVLTVAFVSALFAALVVRLAQSNSGAAFVSAVQAGKKPAAPAFKADVIWSHSATWPVSLRPKVAGGTVTASDLHGYPAVLNFWSSWCTACGRESARLARAARANAGKVVFVGLNVHDVGSDARRFLEHHHENYVSLRSGSLYEDYGLIGLPETYYLDRRGRVVAQTIGEVTQRKLEAGGAPGKSGRDPGRAQPPRR